MTAVYLAGPMTGIPEFNFPAFDAAKEALTAAGFDVISPADLDRENLGFDPTGMTGHEDMSGNRHAYARQDMEALLKVEQVALLDGWQRSTGARNEVRMAHWLGLKVWQLSDGRLIEPGDAFSNVPDPDIVVVAEETDAELSPRADLLREAEGLVDGDRNAQYGDPNQDFKRTADMWTAYLDGKTELEPHDVAAMMALLKISRLRWSPEKRDSWADLAGYAACGWNTVAP